MYIHENLYPGIIFLGAFCPYKISLYFWNLRKILRLLIRIKPKLWSRKKSIPPYCRSPVLGQFHLQNFSAKTAFVVSSKYRATTEAAVSQIAQLDSQSKLATPRRENKKNLTWKGNEHAPEGQQLKICRLIQKTYLKISWDYLFKQILQHCLFL
jgi:hypothetical protein